MVVLVEGGDTDDGGDDGDGAEREDADQGELFGLVDLELEEGWEREKEDDNVTEDVETGLEVVDWDDIVTLLWPGGGPSIGWVLTFKSL